MEAPRSVITLTDEQMEQADYIADLALSEVIRKYGTGYPLFEGGVERTLHYHGGWHTTAVIEGSSDVARRVGLSYGAQAVVKMAAAAHDIIQLQGAGNNERLSADWLERMMRKFSFSELAIKAGRLAILGTQPIMNGNVPIGQAATRQKYESKEARLIALCVAAGDFASLYYRDGPAQAEALFRELNQDLKSINEEEYLSRRLDFQIGQLELVRSYRYPLAEAEHLFAGDGRRERMIEYVQKVLEGLDSGIITVSQLDQMDSQFASECGEEAALWQMRLRRIGHIQRVSSLI